MLGIVQVLWLFFLSLHAYSCLLSVVKLLFVCLFAVSDVAYIEKIQLSDVVVLLLCFVVVWCVVILLSSL